MTDPTIQNAQNAQNATPASAPAAAASALQPDWFGESIRRIGNEPDTRYGWLAHGDQAYIVKALNLVHTNTGSTLLSYERTALSVLNGLHAPVPALWDETAQPLPEGWLATQFSGLSLQRLSLPGTPAQHAGLPLSEQWACWVHFLERAQGMAAKGIIPIDLWAGNLVVPFSQGLQGGQPLLHSAINIDHAHTVAAGWNMRRPVWLGYEMLHIPPELRSLLKADQWALLQHFANQGLPLTGAGASAHTDPPRLARARQLWLTYNQPQRLQQQVDAGRLDAHRTIQYAVGMDLLTHRLAGLPATLQAAVRPVLARMTAHQPTDRYTTVQQAASALRAVLPSVPLVGAAHHSPVGPDTLRNPPPAPAPPPVTLQQRVNHAFRRQPTQNRPLPNWRTPMSERDWNLICLALGLGTAMGTVLLSQPWR